MGRLMMGDDSLEPTFPREASCDGIRVVLQESGRIDAFRRGETIAMGMHAVAGKVAMRHAYRDRRDDASIHVMERDEMRISCAVFELLGVMPEWA